MAADLDKQRHVMTRENPSVLRQRVEAYFRRASEGMSRTEAFIAEQIEERTREDEIFGPPYVKELEDLTGSLVGKRLLEIGSGAGGVTVSMARAGAIAVGIEPMWEGLVASNCRRTAEPNLGCLFVQGLGEELPFADESFDLVISYSVLEHVRDIAQVMRETFRILRPGGRLLHHAPNYLYPWEGHYQLPWLPLLPKPLAKIYVGLHGKDPSFLDTLNYTTPMTLVRACATAGFTRVRDLEFEGLLGKLETPDRFNRPVLRGLGRAMAVIGLRSVGIALVNRIRPYNSIVVTGEKSA
jgi:2-polyprenyl-3-methyl-5-hydroxy-6-metoxy-1,4-benzoquinol methylase